MKKKINKILLWSEKYTKTDMVYLVHSLFWVGISKIFIFLFSFLLMLAFSHFTPKETFGSYQYVISVLGIISVLSLPGTNTSLVKSVAQGKEGTFQLIIKNRLKWSIYGSMVSICIGFWYIFNFNITLGITFLMSAIFLPFFFSYDSFEYFWNGKKNFKKSTLYNAMSTAIPLVAMIAILPFSKNIILIMLVFLFSNTIVRFIYNQKTIGQIKNNEVDPEAIKLGKSLTIIQGIDIFSNYIDKIFIWKFLGPIQLAIYSFAQIPIIKVIQLTPIQAISLPKLSEQNMVNNKSIIMKAFLRLFLIMIPISILFILFIPMLYKVFFPQYQEAIPYVKTLGTLIALMPFTFITTTMIAQSRGSEMIGIQTTTFILKIILFFLFVPLYGIWGIIFTTIGIEITKGLMTIYLFLKKDTYQKVTV
jgi:O-antigen/teichoic acid export membrane protein